MFVMPLASLIGKVTKKRVGLISSMLPISHVSRSSGVVALT